jgi:hypothetical protein
MTPVRCQGGQGTTMRGGRLGQAGIQRLLAIAAAAAAPPALQARRMFQKIDSPGMRSAKSRRNAVFE